MDLTGYASLVAAAWALAAVGTLVWRLGASRWIASHVLAACPTWLAAGVVCGMVGLAVGAGAMHLIAGRSSSETMPGAAPAVAERPALHLPLPGLPRDFKRGRYEAVLADREPAASCGKIAPALKVEGWINVGREGAPDVANRVYVMHLCPGWYGPCREAAVSLFEAHRTYRDQGVTFIGLTAGSRETAEEIIEKSDLPWSLGYGAGETALELYETGATVFVVGADGRIAWHDGLAVYRHGTNDLAALVAKALDRALETSAA